MTPNHDGHAATRSNGTTRAVGNVWLLCTFFLLAKLIFGATAKSSTAQNWPQWRGSENRGFTDANPPISWSTKENVRWSKELPGQGKSTPILWGDQLFVVVAIPNPQIKKDDADKSEQINHNWCVIGIDRHTGQELWRSVLAQEFPHEPGHPTNSLASGSPVTDGKRIYVSLGSRGVYALDLNGNLLWARRLGVMQTRFGFGEASTPAVHKNTLVVPWDHEGQSAIFALNAETGEILWSASRDEPTCWSTPLIVTPTHSLDLTPQVILNGKRIISYRLSDGLPLWRHHHEGVNPIASPIRFQNLAFLMLGYRGYSVQAIDLEKTESNSEDAGRSEGTDASTQAATDGAERPAVIRWSSEETGPYVSSAAICNEKLFVTKGLQGILSVFQAETGRVLLNQRRIEQLGTLYASPLAVSGISSPENEQPNRKNEPTPSKKSILVDRHEIPRLYYCSRDGTTVVIAAEPPFDVLAVNRLEEPIDASPVASGKQLFIRTTRALYCLEQHGLEQHEAASD